MGMYEEQVEALHTFLEGKIVESVEPNLESEGTFTLRLRDAAPEGKRGKIWYVRFFGTDMGYWFETRRGANGQWKKCW